MTPRPARRFLQPQRKYAPLKKASTFQLILVLIISKKRYHFDNEHRRAVRWTALTSPSFQVHLYFSHQQ